MPMAGRHDGAIDGCERRDRNTRAWWLVVALLVAAFLARAPLYLSVFPPFEGWDEYQHLGYIAHLDETGSVPVLDESRVPLALRPLVIAMPHSEWGGDQVREWGAVSYDQYWQGSPPTPATAGEVSSSPRLYQAQHPPLAYVLAWPVWRALKATHPLEAIYTIRAMNILIVAAALVVFAAALPRLVPAFGPRTAVLALVCLHPLFFQNAARVANDALALAAGLTGISLLVLVDNRTLLTRGLLAAGCIATGVWSKQTGLTLIPALVLGLPFLGWMQGVAPGRLWRVTSLAVITLLVLVSPLWLWNYRHYGGIITTQESIELAGRGSVLGALAASFWRLEWLALLETLFVPGRPWVGGWSFLGIQATLARIYGWYWGILLLVAGVGALVALRRRLRPVGETRAVRPGDEGAVGGLLVCAIVVLFTSLGMIHHALVSQAVFGRWTTNPWYFMTALPSLFVLLTRGIEAIDRRLATATAAALVLLFVVIDLHGTWVQMPAAYANSADTTVQWARLTAIHPAVLSGDLRWFFLALQVGALGLVVAGLLYIVRSRVAGR